MLLRARDRRWLTSDVQSDLVLVCSDGAVSAHSALLAGSSPFLASLLSQPSTSHCAGCSSPRRITMAGVGVMECKALVELLYTGNAPLSTDVTKILELCGVLGMELEGLCVSNRGGGVGEVRVDVDMRVDRSNSDTSMLDTRINDDIVDSVHPRFVKAVATKNRSVVEDPSPIVRVPVLSPKPIPVTPSKTPTKVVAPPSSSPSIKESPSHKLSSPPLPVANHTKTYINRKQRLSHDSLAETLKSFPLKKLPFKTPDIPDTILPEVPNHAARGYSELSRSSTPAVLQYLQSPQVMLPDNVLTEVMGMVPDAIKQEVEDVPDISCDVRDGFGEIADLTDIAIGAEVTYGEGAEDIQDLRDMVDPLRNTPTPPYPQLEGRGDDDSPNSPPVTAYLSMDNARNYVCNNCDQGFTFVRSFNWHRKRCQEALPVKQEEKKKPGDEMSLALDDLVKLENVEVKVVKISTKQCVICDKSVNGLKSHLSMVHFKAKIISDYCSNPRQCKICKNPFKSLHGLILHIGVHHNMVKKYLKEHEKAKKRKRIVLEKTRPDWSPEEKKKKVVVREKENVKISVVTEAKEKMRNRLVNKEKHRSIKNKILSATNVKAVNRIVAGERDRSVVTKPVTKVGDVEKMNVVRKAVSEPAKPTKSRTVSRDSETGSRSWQKNVARNHVDTVKTKVSGGRNNLDTVKTKVSGGRNNLDTVKTKVSGGRKVSCGECVKCLMLDCGVCIHCSDKPEFGGRGKLHNRVCIKKVCRSKVWSEVMVSPSLVKGSKVKR